MDKVELIRQEIERLKESGCASSIVICDTLLSFIDSLQEEPKENISNELKVAADNALEGLSDKYDIIGVGSCLEMFRLGAQWQKSQLLKNAIGSKVIEDAGGYPCVACVVELYDYDKDVPLAKKGDKVKIVVIKEEE